MICSFESSRWNACKYQRTPDQPAPILKYLAIRHEAEHFIPRHPLRPTTSSHYPGDVISHSYKTPGFPKQQTKMAKPSFNNFFRSFPDPRRFDSLNLLFILFSSNNSNINVIYEIILFPRTEFWWFFASTFHHSSPRAPSLARSPPPKDFTATDDCSSSGFFLFECGLSGYPRSARPRIPWSRIPKNTCPEIFGIQSLEEEIQFPETGSFDGPKRQELDAISFESSMKDLHGKGFRSPDSKDHIRDYNLFHAITSNDEQSVYTLSKGRSGSRPGSTIVNGLTGICQRHEGLEGAIGLEGFIFDQGG